MLFGTCVELERAYCSGQVTDMVSVSFSSGCPRLRIYVIGRPDTSGDTGTRQLAPELVPYQLRVTSASVPALIHVFFSVYNLTNMLLPDVVQS
jgi:hypothetical protein